MRLFNFIPKTLIEILDVSLQLRVQFFRFRNLIAERRLALRLCFQCRVVCERLLFQLVIELRQLAPIAGMQFFYLAVEYGSHNIRVNAISPGLVRTDFARALWENPEILKERTSGDPLRRIGEPHEIAGSAVYLASAAGSFTTGQNIVVDGGSTIT